ncbi:MAG TPA: divalent metal cation transporter [Ktedonobacteraceae bacterium]|nr:divalent metal cation transporter [Ktedonobacteraceae bacterium]
MSKSIIHQKESGGSEQQEHHKQQGKQKQPSQNKIVRFLRNIGPGFLGGMAGNDATAVATYSIDGARVGFSHLWLMLLSTPMYFSVQFACAEIGRITQEGFGDILRESYGRWVAALAALVLVLANTALVAGNLVAVGSGLQLITGISWVWFVVPIAVILWYITVFRNFRTIEKIFTVLSLAFVTYIVTAIFSHANWGAVFVSTFVPKVSFNFADISAAVALLGATISPYTMYWQVKGESEERRVGTFLQKLREAAGDIATGVISGNLVSYFIIITAAATLFTHHKSIQTAADAAQALQPLLGPFAKYLFAVGLIGAGVVAIPVMLASTSYGVSDIFAWPCGLSEKPSRAKGFYIVLSLALLASLGLALLRIDPITLIFYANVLVGVLSPIMIVFLVMIGNNRKIMRGKRLSWPINVLLVLAALVMFSAAILFFWGLATGQGGS